MLQRAALLDVSKMGHSQAGRSPHHSTPENRRGEAAASHSSRMPRVNFGVWAGVVGCSGWS